LAKYAEVLGQIECAKDVHEQLKKIQTDVNNSFSFYKQNLLRIFFLDSEKSKTSFETSS
jgi:hypothetical protein